LRHGKIYKQELAMKVIKKMVVLWFVLFFCRPGYGEEVNSLIKKVILFSDNALVTRETLVHAKRGENVLKISGLTPYFDDSSLHDIEVEFSAVITQRTNEDLE